MNAHLEPDEAIRLEMLEEVIRAGMDDLQAWLNGPQLTEGAVESLEALQQIRQEKLYRKDGADWPTYLASWQTKRWPHGITPQHAGRLFRAVAVYRLLEKSEPAGSVEDLTERQIRAALDQANREGHTGPERLERAADILRGLPPAEQLRIIQGEEDRVLAEAAREQLRSQCLLALKQLAKAYKTSRQIGPEAEEAMDCLTAAARVFANVGNHELPKCFAEEERAERRAA